MSAAGVVFLGVVAVMVGAVLLIVTYVTVKAGARDGVIGFFAATGAGLVIGGFFLAVAAGVAQVMIGLAS